MSETTKQTGSERQGWAVAIRRDDGTEFLACSTPGDQPAVWAKCNRSSAVAHRRELKAEGFRCRVVAVKFTSPEIL